MQSSGATSAFCMDLVNSMSIVYRANHLEKKHWCAQDHWGSFRSWNPSTLQLNFQALSWALSKPDSMSIMRSFMCSKSGFHCSSKVRIRRLCWENNYICIYIYWIPGPVPMQRHFSLCDVMNRKEWCEVNRLGRSFEFIHWFTQFKLDLKRAWINSWTRVRQLTKRLGGKQVYWVYSSDISRNRNCNSEISHLLKLRNLPKVLPRQHLEP